MADREFIEALGAWEGFEVSSIAREAHDQLGTIVEIQLRCTDRRAGRCSGCGHWVREIHDVSERRVRDLPILDAATILIVPRYRLACPRCGPKVERIRWLERYSRVTKRFAASIARLCDALPIKDVAEFCRLGWDTVKRIHKEALRAAVPGINPEDLEVLAIDEFAIQKGHRYATVVINPRCKKVLWVGRGRGRDDVRKFFEHIGKDGRDRIRAVVMDMNGAYANEVRTQCPDAEIVYDQFHVVAKYAREVVDRVRVDEANRVGSDRESRKWIKGSRWLLLRNRKNLSSQDERTRLSQLLRENRNLLKVYLLKDDLKHLWSYRYPAAARRFWKSWKHRACCSRLEPLRRFARRLDPYIEGIIAHCRWPYHTSILEGINNKIKVIKRMAYGYRDDEYFFLRIRAAFPGNAG